MKVHKVEYDVFEPIIHLYKVPFLLVIFFRQLGSLRWSSNAGDLSVPFFGTPFCINGIRLLECIYGPRRPTNNESEEVGISS